MINRNPTRWSLVTAAAIVVASSLAGAQEKKKVSVHCYNGSRRVEFDLALDEVWQPAVPPQRSGFVRVARVDTRAAFKAAVTSGSGTRLAVLYNKGATARRSVLTRQMAIKLSAGEEINPIIEEFDFELANSSLGADTYILTARGNDPLRALEVANTLYESGRAEWAYPMISRARARKLTPDDPLFESQWHLKNDGDEVAGAVAGNDVNITAVWDAYLGTGINIAFVDDGLETTHPDLTANVRTDIDYDYANGDTDPSHAAGDYHGTQVAGIAAARGNNTLGVTGAAPQASIVAVKLLEGLSPTTDAMEASALLHNYDSGTAADDTHISNNSWGVADDGFTVDGPWPLAQAALVTGVTSGRGGKGIIYVWAAGNGYEFDDDSNYDWYTNSRYTISVAATRADGASSFYSEFGCATLVNAPSSEEELSPPVWSYGITTTDPVGATGDDAGDYTNESGKTSAAASLVSGVVALVLEANPDLGWRDVQHILATTSTQNLPGDLGWQTNGAGLTYHHYFGFGRVDAGAAVTAALSHSNLPAEMTSITDNETGNWTIPDDQIPANALQRTFTVASTDMAVEYVKFSPVIDHGRMGELQYTLTSPSGTIAMVRQRTLDNSAAIQMQLDFGTVAFWGEDPTGIWTLTVYDTEIAFAGTLRSWSMEIFGHDGATSVSTIENQTILSDVAAAPIPFTVADPDTPLDTLTVTAVSDDQTLITDVNLVLAGTGADRTLTITPEASQTGTATITVTVSDGVFSDATVFDVTVASGLPTVTLTAASSSGDESVTPVTLNLTMSAASTPDVTVGYIVTAASTATGGGQDYTLANGTVTFTNPSQAESISLVIVDDLRDEAATEAVVVQLTYSTNAAFGATTTYTYTINDNDATPDVEFDVATEDILENVGTVDLDVTLTNPSDYTVTVDYTVADGSATSGFDYTLASGTLSFAPGSTSETITATIINSSGPESLENFTVTLSNPANAALGTNTVSTVNITDDDNASPTISTIPDQTIIQGVASAPIHFIVGDANTAQASLVITTVSDDTGVVDHATDIAVNGTTGNRTLVITPGASASGTANITVTVSDGNTSASDTFQVTVVASGSVPTVSFALQTDTNDETVASPAIAVELSAASGPVVTVEVEIIGGTAIGGGTDYTLATGTITFTNPSVSEDVALTIVDETLYETDETIIIRIVSATNAAIGTGGSDYQEHTYTITNEDPMPTFSGGGGSCTPLEHGADAQPASLALIALIVYAGALATRKRLAAAPGGRHG